MLFELSITDFAIIEHTTLRFSEGLTVLTGETGAGKSILLDALGAVLGARMSSDLVRSGCSTALVEAAFDLSESAIERLRPVAEDLGVADIENGALVLAREINANGRSTARANGRMATAGMLAQLGAHLVDIHGQSDHLAILKSDEQLNLLDRYAGTLPEREAFSGIVARWHHVRRQRSTLETQQRDRAQRSDLLAFQAAEIAHASLQVGEDEALLKERDVLRNADRLRADAREIYAALMGNDDDFGIASSLRRITSVATDLANVDLDMSGIVERTNDLLVLAEDLAREIRDYAENIESDEKRLEVVEERLEAIRVLKRKYGSTILEIIASGVAAQSELDYLNSAEFDDQALAEEQTRYERALADVGMQLSERRQAAAIALAVEIEHAISQLNMGNAKVEITISQREDPAGIVVGPAGRCLHVDETGVDRVEFLIAPNAGEMLKPLARIASGGETARLMLAIKSILSRVDLTPTLIFDEIDVGVGGRSGQVVAEKLWSIAKDHQVIVVTHLPQIAAMADAHLKIEKTDNQGRTTSSVRNLDHDARIAELAAMLDGTPLSQAAVHTAAEMLARARKVRHE